ncbi:hypothetical protein ACM66B_004463 [Microbotryomycetes sp. NB124-2]
MMYHTQSLLDNDYTTTVVAYKGSAPLKSLTTHSKCTFVYLSTPLAFASNLPRTLFLLLAPLKVGLGAWNLLWTVLWRLETTPEFIIVQNPPSIPTLPVLQIAACLTGSKLVIDWHNTGFSVLAMRLGDQHPVVRIAKLIEYTFGRNAYAHLCVTDAMKRNLENDARPSGHIRVFYDRPPKAFRRLDANEIHEFLMHEPTFVSDQTLQSFVSPTPNSTMLTTRSLSDADALFRQDRPALIVSATSWTADEDFNLLLDSLSLYDKAAQSLDSGQGGVPRSSSEPKSTLPKVVVIVTGKGALKRQFEERVGELEKEWKWVKVRTAWLAIQDYPKLLGSADLGVSLHTSTSGSDLPMKVVDMFGCGLPVCALNFACLNELVKHERNGLVFDSSQSLANSFIDLLKSSDSQRLDQKQDRGTFPLTEKLGKLKTGIETTRYGTTEAEWRDWQTNWNQIVRPLLQ